MINREQIGDILMRIYRAEIPARLEWVFDGGFVWALLGWGNAPGERPLPRMWLDDALAGHTVTAQSPDAARAADAGQHLAIDWLERGAERTIEAAIQALSDAIVRRLPDSEFSRWWRSRA